MNAHVLCMKVCLVGLPMCAHLIIYMGMAGGLYTFKYMHKKLCA